MRVVTVGGSVARLALARLLARRGHDMTVVARDGGRTPPGPQDAGAAWLRPGVPHSASCHLQRPGRDVLRDHLPDVYEAWLAARKAVAAQPVSPC